MILKKRWLLKGLYSLFIFGFPRHLSKGCLHSLLKVHPEKLQSFLWVCYGPKNKGPNGYKLWPRRSPSNMSLTGFDTEAAAEHSLIRGGIDILDVCVQCTGLRQRGLAKDYPCVEVHQPNVNTTQFAVGRAQSGPVRPDSYGKHAQHRNTFLSNSIACAPLVATKYGVIVWYRPSGSAFTVAFIIIILSWSHNTLYFSIFPQT